MSWSRIVKLGEIPVALSLEADEATRKALAKELNLASLDALSGEIRVTPWMDGAEISGHWKGAVTLTCGITLEPFEERYDEAMLIRAVPPTSPHAAPPEAGPDGDIELDLEADDPPDVLEGDAIDVAAYLVEQLVLAVPPFPRKPGAVFEPPPPEEPPSPFAVLVQLKPKEDDKA